MTSWLKSGVAGGVDFAYFVYLTGDVLSIRVGWGGGMITFLELIFPTWSSKTPRRSQPVCRLRIWKKRALRIACQNHKVTQNDAPREYAYAWQWHRTCGMDVWNFIPDLFRGNCIGSWQQVPNTPHLYWPLYPLPLTVWSDFGKDSRSLFRCLAAPATEQHAENCHPAPWGQV